MVESYRRLNSTSNNSDACINVYRRLYFLIVLVDCTGFVMTIFLTMMTW